jgi:hypothetical protein
MKLKSIIKESSLSRIWKHATEHESGTITAFRSARDCGKGQKYTQTENRTRNAELKAKLQSMGYGLTAVNGYYVENYGSPSAKKVKEESFVVVDLKDKGTLKQDLIKLGTYFEQDSITWSKPSGEYYLISTNTCPEAYPGKGKIGVTDRLGKPLFGKDGTFHSTINGRPFVFTEVVGNFTSLTDYPPTEIRSILKLAEQVKLTD